MYEKNVVFADPVLAERSRQITILSLFSEFVYFLLKQDAERAIEAARSIPSAKIPDLIKKTISDIKDHSTSLGADYFCARFLCNYIDGFFDEIFVHLENHNRLLSDLNAIKGLVETIEDYADLGDVSQWLKNHVAKLDQAIIHTLKRQIRHATLENDFNGYKRIVDFLTALSEIKIYYRLSKSEYIKFFKDLMPQVIAMAKEETQERKLVEIFNMILAPTLGITELEDLRHQAITTLRLDLQQRIAKEPLLKNTQSDFVKLSIIIDCLTRKSTIKGYDDFAKESLVELFSVILPPISAGLKQVTTQSDITNTFKRLIAAYHIPEINKQLFHLCNDLGFTFYQRAKECDNSLAKQLWKGRPESFSLSHGVHLFNKSKKKPRWHETITNIRQRQGERAFNHFNTAIQQGNYEGYRFLAHCYIEGVGVKKNFKLALQYLYVGAKEGDKEAEKMLMSVYDDIHKSEDTIDKMELYKLQNEYLEKLGIDVKAEIKKDKPGPTIQIDENAELAKLQKSVASPKAPLHKQEAAVSPLVISENKSDEFCPFIKGLARGQYKAFAEDCLVAKEIDYSEKESNKIPAKTQSLPSQVTASPHSFFAHNGLNSPKQLSADQLLQQQKIRSELTSIISFFTTHVHAPSEKMGDLIEFEKDFASEIDQMWPKVPTDAPQMTQDVRQHYDEPTRPLHVNA